jgi:MFS family permease
VTTASSTVNYPHLRRNLFMLYVDYAAFGIGASLLGSGPAVVPSFVRQLTDSQVLIGLAGSLFTVCWLLPQLFLAPVFSRHTHRKRFMNPSGLFRLAILLMAMLIGMFGADNPGMTLVAFFGLYAFFAATDAWITLAWGDFLGSSVPNHLRGTLFGVGQFTVAISALGTSALARWALSDSSGLVFPHNYALLFGIASIFYVVGGAALALCVEEPANLPTETGPPLREYLPLLLKIVRQDRAFLRFARTRVLLDLAMMGVPFYVVFAVTVLGLQNASVVSDTILLVQFGSVAGAVIMGVLSRRSGPKAVIRIASLAITVQALLAVLSAFVVGVPALYTSFFMLGIVYAITVPSYFDWIITHAPATHRPTYIGLSNTISAVSSLAPLVGGIILQWTMRPNPHASWNIPRLLFGSDMLSLTSYPVLFVAATVLGLLGFLSMRTMHEPREHNGR